MVKQLFTKKALVWTGIAGAVMCLLAPAGMAQEAAEAGVTVGEGLRAAGIAIGAGLAILGSAFGTGRAQAAIGAGGTGAMAEKPELFGRVLVLVALPEVIVVLGFVLGIVIALNI